MNRKLKYTLVGLLILFLWWTYPWIITAGGAGNIAIYDLEVSKTEFELTIDSVIAHNLKIGIPDTNIYSLRGTGYEEMNKYIYYVQESDTFVFRYGYVQYGTDWESKPNFSIALTHVGKSPRKTLKYGRELLPFQDIKWEKRFENLLRECNLKFEKE